MLSGEMKGLLLWSSLLCALIMAAGGTSSYNVHRGLSYRAILDTDVDTDDLFALLYLLKSNRSEFNLQVLLLHIFCTYQYSYILCGEFFVICICMPLSTLLISMGVWLIKLFLKN
ncbi:putative ribonucleoside hydrolase [Helianthus annuus]|uniref:Ribonucleoside hydrolase n=1 Tax=Helianthus annuus TaxID=4232 RepID=A0A9K3JHG7_HELAN|nr:putative ribonucleoside hydrolase [Helianthus annuus]KAJ0593980.1 putative ribonucleoside hydrolase [Helianthus annuus]KAJ0774815.1 putative ribonucleoside hydrolase [Helianthus annuus]KAJ0944805.1 putative ribonucleoside hydrolase [Helianthus annuus]